ncbi:prostate and testis expressed protein 4 [Acomys russatus]|uniref:prostate and testis expressed protein 4 n=1 Tax=Acomys russatus TaxID=60746 RepID=UPI0021E2CCC5|nr:prostate and testis expressed protein 4 [Acomys russatus]
MNPVTKIGTLLILTLSILCSVEGLICNICERSVNSRCKLSRSTCLAKLGQRCSTISYFYGPKHVYSRQLCMSGCKEMQTYNGMKLTYIMCCDKNLCNTF